MFGLEKELYEQIVYLRKSFGLVGIKAEFEAEGSTFRDLVRLRRLTAMADAPLYLKIGGAEAVRDIKDSLELGVDGLIVPMIESEFALKKFIDAYKSIYKNSKIKLSINIETETAIDRIEDILQLANENNIDNITLGRTDLSASYMSSNITPDTDQIYDLISYIGYKTVDFGMDFTVGGSIGSRTINVFKKNLDIIKYVKNIETRKVILPREIMINKDQALNEALKFEELYILSKKEINDTLMEADLARLKKLSGRKN
jgi:hypothetical protein